MWQDDPVGAGRICLIFTDEYTNTEWRSHANTLENMSTDTDGEVSPLTILQIYYRGLFSNLRKSVSHSQQPFSACYVNTMTPHSDASNSVMQQNGLQQYMFTTHLDVIKMGRKSTSDLHIIAGQI